nr:hypothetical protein [uncultured Psychroserpens sp.]
MSAKNNKVKNFIDFRELINSSETIKSEFLNDPITFLEQTIEQPPMQDKSVFLKIVYIVGISLLLCIIVSAVISLWFPIIEYTNIKNELIQEKREIDSFFVMIASASIGALAGLLVPTPKQ